MPSTQAALLFPTMALCAVMLYLAALRLAPMPCNAVWGMGLTFKQDEAGDLHPILGIIDHGSPK